jgi:hypothetical protein
MRHHIDVLGLLHTVWGGVAALAGLSLVILAAGTDAAVAANAVTPAVRATGASAAVWLLAATGIVLLIAGVGLVLTGVRLRQTLPRARRAALILAIPNLLLLPFGTALGIYTYWVLLNNDARLVFGRPERSASA